ncbi:MAG: T9SS type A sorting domain-containing protein [Saprospiraceae bacterium]|nr:T9SS type A sorting domain-containing protein [Saprospiraceae bacterium]
MAKVSPSGDSIWIRKYAVLTERESEHKVYDVKETPDGGIILCGETLDWGSDATYPQQGWLLKLDWHGCLVPGCHLTDATTEGQAPEVKLAIYPNPTTDYLNFYVASPLPPPKEGALFRIIGSDGRLVKEFEAANLDATFIVPVWDLADGVYWLQYVHGKQVVHSEKFVKQ